MGKFKHDILGQRFGHLEVTERDYTRKGRVAWFCRCDCGNTRSALSHNLMSGASFSCGCVSRRPKPREVIEDGAPKLKRTSKYIGKKSHYLVAKEYFVDEVSGRQKFLCECICGKTIKVQYANFVGGRQKSCGCIKPKPSRKTHGMSLTKEYRTWAMLMRRVKDSEEAKGNLVCAAWLSFENFFEDLGPKPTSKHKLLRRDIKAPYDRTNCFWGIYSEGQVRHHRTKYDIKIDGKDFSVRDLAKEAGLSHQAIYLRLQKPIDLKLLKEKQIPQIGRYVLNGERTTIKKAANTLAINYSSLIRRMKSKQLSLEQAIALGSDSTKIRGRESFEVLGERLTKSAISQRYGICPRALLKKLNRGIPPEQIVSEHRLGKARFYFKGKQMSFREFIKTSGADPQSVREKFYSGLDEDQIVYEWRMFKREQRAEAGRLAKIRLLEERAARKRKSGSPPEILSDKQVLERVILLVKEGTLDLTQIAVRLRVSVGIVKSAVDGHINLNKTKMKRLERVLRDILAAGQNEKN